MIRGRISRATAAIGLLSLAFVGAGLIASPPGTAASSSASVAIPDPPTLVSAQVYFVMLPIQDGTTFKYIDHRKFGIVRSVWDVSSRTDIPSFTAGTTFYSANNCAANGECPGGPFTELTMNAPGLTVGRTCTQNVTDLRVTEDCYIEMTRYQAAGRYFTVSFLAQWQANDGTSEVGSQNFPKKLTTRLQNATRLTLKAPNTYQSATGRTLTHISGVLRRFTITQKVDGLHASYTKAPDQEKVALFWWSNDWVEPRFVAYVNETSTGYAKTLTARANGRWYVKYAGTTSFARSDALVDADPIIIP